MNEASISPEDTARILNKSIQFVRIGLQKERLPFGTAVLIDKQWSYHISPKLLAEYIGEEKLNKYFKKGGDQNGQSN